MKYENYLTLKFPSKEVNEEIVCSAVAAFVNQLDITLIELTNIRTAVSEAVTNCVKHAYPNKIGTITVECKILRKHVVDIVVKDSGVGIRDIDQARQPMYTTGDTEHCGMGFSIMESFVDELDVTSTAGCGTVVHMRKYLKSRM